MFDGAIAFEHRVLKDSDGAIEIVFRTTDRPFELLDQGTLSPNRE
jgi:hypothetical protein